MKLCMSKNQIVFVNFVNICFLTLALSDIYSTTIQSRRDGSRDYLVTAINPLEFIH